MSLKHGVGFLGDRLRDRVEDVAVALEKRVGLPVAHDGFAEQIDGRGDPDARVATQLLDEVRRGLPRDELRRHPSDVGRHRPGHERRGERRRGQSGLERGIEFDGLVSEIFLQVTNDLGRRGQRRQYVDEAEELHLERGILHRPLHQAAVDALFRKRSGSVSRVHERKELLALRPDGGFQRGIRRGVSRRVHRRRG